MNTWTERQIGRNHCCRTEERKKDEKKWGQPKRPKFTLWGGEKEKGPKKIFEEVRAENFPNMGKETLTQLQEAQRVPYKVSQRRNTGRHILIKLTTIKDKENIKSNKGKATNNIQRNPIPLSANFSVETLQARRESHSIFKVMKRENL